MYSLVPDLTGEVATRSIHSPIAFVTCGTTWGEKEKKGKGKKGERKKKSKKKTKK